jgi:hypothetical protein
MAMRSASTPAVLVPVLAASVVCLAAAFGTAGLWVPACLVPLPAVLLLFHRRIRGGWAAPLFLVVMMGAAAAGAMVGASAFLLIPGAALALAAWDLADFHRFVRSGRSPQPAAALERRHALSLAKAISVGLLAAVGGASLALRIPFIVMFLLVILDLLCLGLALRALQKR